MTEQERIDHDDLILLKSGWRARREIRLTVNANIDAYGKERAKFVTLTFKEDIRDLKVANPLFKKFIKRLNYSQGEGFKAEYVARPEFQDKRRKGVVHYHVMFFNLPFIKASDLRTIWGHGFVKINAIDDVDNVGAYMVGYMSKKLVDRRYLNEKRFFTSKGLVQAQEERGYSTKDFEPGPEWQVKFECSFENEYVGKINYKQFEKVKKTLDKEGKKE